MSRNSAKIKRDTSSAVGCWNNAFVSSTRPPASLTEIGFNSSATSARHKLLASTPHSPLIRASLKQTVEASQRFDATLLKFTDPRLNRCRPFVFDSGRLDQGRNKRNSTFLLLNEFDSWVWVHVFCRLDCCLHHRHLSL